MDLDYPCYICTILPHRSGQICYYLNDHAAKNWVQVEESAVAPYKLSDIIWNSSKHRARVIYDNPFLQLTLNIWDKMRLKFTNLTSPLTSF